MFRQVGPFVTIITAPGGLGLSTCDIDDGLEERDSRTELASKIRS
jgi:hypothetical protein